MLDNWQGFDLGDWCWLYLNLRLRYWLRLVVNHCKRLHGLLCVLVLVNNDFSHGLLRSQRLLLNFRRRLRLIGLILNNVYLDADCGVEVLSELILLVGIDGLLRHILMSCFAEGKGLVDIINRLDCVIFHTGKDVFCGKGCGCRVLLEELASFSLKGFLQACILIEHSIEALDFSLVEIISATGLLNEANHGFVTLHAEMFFGVRVDLSKGVHVLDVVPEVGDISLTVIKLNKESLVVEHIPSSINFISVGVLGSHLRGCSYMDIYLVFRLEHELIVLVYDLNIVR